MIMSTTYHFVGPWVPIRWLNMIFGLCSHQHIFNETSLTGIVDSGGHVEARVRHMYDPIPLYECLASSHDEASATAIED